MVTTIDIQSLTQTWNAIGTTFTGIKLNVTDSASAAASLLMDLQVGAASKFSVSKGGAGTLSASLAIGGATIGTNALAVTGTGNISSALTLGTSGVLNGGTNLISQYNSTSAQRGQWFNTRTDASNGEWFDIDWITNTNVATIGTNANGTGVARNLRINIGGVNKLDYGISAAATWRFQTSVQNTGDFEAQSGMFASVNSSFNSGAGFKAPSADVMTLLNWATTGAPLVTWGPATSSFPAFKRNTTILQARLADDSAYAPLQGKLTTDTAATTGLTAGVLAATTNTSIVLYDSTGQAYRVPCII